jgi:hypothetical protein
MRSPGLILGSAKGEFSGRPICDAIVMQFRTRSAMRVVSILGRREGAEEASAELCIADASRSICRVVMFSWSEFRNTLRIKARRGIWGSMI